MKISVWWLLAVPVLIAGIASSQAGFSVVWDYEMKRPEAQKAIGEYIRSRCNIMYMGDRDKPITGEDVIRHVQLYCSAAQPAK